MKFGTELKFECPDECPADCALKKQSFGQGDLCCRCPVFLCQEPVTEEDRMYLPVLEPTEFRDDWAAQWETFFKTERKPVLYL